MKLVVPLFMDLEKALQEKTDSQDKNHWLSLFVSLDSCDDRSWQETRPSRHIMRKCEKMCCQMLEKYRADVEYIDSKRAGSRVAPLSSVFHFGVIFNVLSLPRSNWTILDESNSTTFQCLHKKRHIVYIKNICVYIHTWCLLYTHM